MRNLLDWCSATVCCVSTRAGKNARKTDEKFGIEEYFIWTPGIRAYADAADKYGACIEVPLANPPQISFGKDANSGTMHSEG